MKKIEKVSHRSIRGGKVNFFEPNVANFLLSFLWIYQKSREQWIMVA